jgi:hypothetical protein
MAVRTRPDLVESDRPWDQPPATGAWWRRPFSVFQTNLQEIDARLDVEKVLDFIEDYGADTWLLNTGGIVSFYPTDLPFQTRNPFLSDRATGDLIGDAVTAAQQRNIRVIARMDFSKVAARIAAEHPDWLFESPDGERQVYNTLVSTCPSGPYFQEHSLEILDEVLERYPVAGFFVNQFKFSERDYSRVYHGVCHCENCQNLFAAFSGGQQLPAGPRSPLYPEWLRFTDQLLTRLAGKIADHLAVRAPQAGLLLNRGAPITYYEANNAFGREPWHHATTENVSAHMAARPEISLMVNAVSFVDMPYRMAGEQPEHFAQYLIQAIARGGSPSTYIMGAPERTPYAAMTLGREITRFHRQNIELYEQLRPAATTALVRPDRLRSADPDYADMVEEFRGIYSSLQERHHPFDVVPQELVGKMAREGALQRYSLLILPDLGPLGSTHATALDAFVRQGGRLLLTGRSGVTETGEVELETSPALMRVGAQLSGRDLWSTYATDHEQPWLNEYRYEPTIVPVFGNYSRFVWRPAALKMGTLLPQAPFGPPEKCYGHTGSDDPHMVEVQAGKGRVRLVPWTIGRTYREFGTTDVRDQLIAAVESIAPTAVSASLPEQVELILGRDDEGYVLHLLNQSGARRRSFGPHLTVPGGEIRIRGLGDGTRVEALVSTQEVQVTQDGEGVAIALPPVELFEVLRVRSC